MSSTLFTTGIACIVAAIIGGGLKAFGLEIPILQSLRRQVLLAAFGLTAVGAGLLLSKTIDPPSGAARQVKASTASESPANGQSTVPASTQTESAGQKPVPGPGTDASVDTKFFSEEVKCRSGSLGDTSDVIACDGQNVLVSHGVTITIPSITEDDHGRGWVEIKGTAGGKIFSGQYQKGDIVTLDGDECSSFTIIVIRIKSSISWRDDPPNDTLQADLSLQGKCKV